MFLFSINKDSQVILSHHKIKLSIFSFVLLLLGLGQYAIASDEERELKEGVPFVRWPVAVRGGTTLGDAELEKISSLSPPQKKETLRNLDLNALSKNGLQKFASLAYEEEELRLFDEAVERLKEHMGLKNAYEKFLVSLQQKVGAHIDGHQETLKNLEKTHADPKKAEEDYQILTVLRICMANLVIANEMSKNLLLQLVPQIMMRENIWLGRQLIDLNGAMTIREQEATIRREIIKPLLNGSSLAPFLLRCIERLEQLKPSPKTEFLRQAVSFVLNGGLGPWQKAKIPVNEMLSPTVFIILKGNIQITRHGTDLPPLKIQYTAPISSAEKEGLRPAIVPISSPVVGPDRELVEKFRRVRAKTLRNLAAGYSGTLKALEKYRGVLIVLHACIVNRIIAKKVSNNPLLKRFPELMMRENIWIIREKPRDLNAAAGLWEQEETMRRVMLKPFSKKFEILPFLSHCTQQLEQSPHKNEFLRQVVVFLLRGELSGISRTLAKNYPETTFTAPPPVKTKKSAPTLKPSVSSALSIQLRAIRQVEKHRAPYTSDKFAYGPPPSTEHFKCLRHWSLFCHMSSWVAPNPNSLSFQEKKLEYNFIVAGPRGLSRQSLQNIALSKLPQELWQHIMITNSTWSDLWSLLRTSKGLYRFRYAPDFRKMWEKIHKPSYVAMNIAETVGLFRERLHDSDTPEFLSKDLWINVMMPYLPWEDLYNVLHGGVGLFNLRQDDTFKNMWETTHKPSYLNFLHRNFKELNKVPKSYRALLAGIDEKVL